MILGFEFLTMVIDCDKENGNWCENVIICLNSSLSLKYSLKLFHVCSTIHCTMCNNIIQYLQDSFQNVQVLLRVSFQTQTF